MSRLRSGLCLAGLLVMVAVTGCVNPYQRFTGRTTPVTPSPPPPQTAPVAAPTPAPTAPSGPEQVVTAYLKALNDGHYDLAYDMLSQASRDTHARAKFAQDGQQGMPRYDLSGLTAIIRNNRADVDVKFEEETGSHGFSLDREHGEWKVVYRGGRPGQPYPD